ncbi:hypothetical protein FA15DRAFT_666880 [Coprinopsis marcescibilis]|uniref:RING-type domain-containing protein n=1 Tax=Coprinopsis marcescibilis TaxID=230819 RepID=A0A5C3LEM5_COPMA|nr:hypothetical protein FA15DRAFT_666880 [Coprinopsis marcescibilis]
MLDTISNHLESIHLRSGPRNYGPDLNLALLEELTRRATKSATKSSKKRTRSPDALDRHSKRSRTTDGASTYETQDPAPRHVDAFYPHLARIHRRFALDPIEGKCAEIPVLRHVLDIQYSDMEAGSNFAELVQETQSNVPETTTLHISNIKVIEHNSRCVAVAGENQWLLLLPTLVQDADDYDYDNTMGVSDLVTTCLILRDADKITLSGKISLVLNPPGAEVPFRLQVEFIVKLRFPNIFASLSRKEPRKSVLLVENAQRRLFAHIYGQNYESGPEANISQFYTVLHAARKLPSMMADDAMQPALLNPTLLPFQRRSVGWLLEREGMEVKSDGTVVPGSNATFSFWDTITEGNQTFHYNRLQGKLSQEPPPQTPAFGGILAEEPGLGKTLETISLILLNPAPESRNPSVTRWDPEARLDVKAVKTSLIVTPPALASQWIDEISAHAPSLKILVYDGWSKVKVPITRQAPSTATVTPISESKSKIKGKGKAPSKTAAKVEETVANAVRFDGSEMTKDADGNLLDWCEFVHQFDIVVTTYQVLRSDFNVARAVPVRPRREDVVYANVNRPRSPLVLVEWNRVIMDEVQMVGGGKTEDMVSLIPRLSSFAVSGTPARAQISDMIHVLKFLRVDDAIGSTRHWQRLLKAGYAHEFAAFFQTYGVRTTKASVKEELTIPQQTRYLVSVELGKVERHVYDQTMEQMLLELGLDARGVAASEGWEVDATLLRSSVRRLRGICTHPQVGQLLRKGELYKKGALKSMDAVLENMRDHNWRNVMDHWKSKIQAIIRYAQLVQQNDDAPDRLRIAREALDLALAETNNLVDEINKQLTEHRARGEVLKKEATALRLERAKALASGATASSSADKDKDKGKGRAMDQEDEDSGSDSGDEDDYGEEEQDKGIPKTLAGKEHRTKTATFKMRLREAKLLMHRVKFLHGDVYHMLGHEFSAKEDEAYADAEGIRRDLLKVTEEDATRAMNILQENTKSKIPTLREMEITVPYLLQGGIRSDELMEEANTLIDDVLNAQSRLLSEWRARIMELLTEKLNAGDEADGQEYQRNLDNQSEAEVYMQAYGALLADRREALVNERTLLAAHDAREKRLRHTKAAMKAATALDQIKQMQNFDSEHLQMPQDFEMHPEHQVLYKQLSDQRKALVAELNGRAIKSVLVELNGINARITSKNDPEKQIVHDAIVELRSLISSQGVVHDKLDADLTLIRKAFNERILYFRQLQEISDSVAEVDWEEPTLEVAIEVARADRAEHDEKLNTNRARHRYLVNLAVNSKGGTSADDEENVCILCRCDFIRGFITQCAHIFCEGCMKAWLSRREGKTCPVCRVRVDPDTVQRFTTTTGEEAPRQPINGEAAPQSHRKIVYNNIDTDLYDQIQKVESYGDFGSKIQMLVRHLLYLQTSDTGAKSIVFSAWADSLHIVELALNRNGIKCLRIDQNSKGESAAKKFRTDPEILVLLLHGERENAGLNVTCASRVFLLESVVHHSFELQAIARIDRMGQTRPTEVFCYYAEDTVERNILDLAARKGLSLYTKENSTGTLDVSSFSAEQDKAIVDSPAKKMLKGDFILKVDDMLACLFPHMYEELEFLIPPDSVSEDTEMTEMTSLTSDLAPTTNQTTPMSEPSNPFEVQPVAGPSREGNAVAGPSRPRRTRRR